MAPKVPIPAISALSRVKMPFLCNMSCFCFLRLCFVRTVLASEGRSWGFVAPRLREKSAHRANHVENRKTCSSRRHLALTTSAEQSEARSQWNRSQAHRRHPCPQELFCSMFFWHAVSTTKGENFCRRALSIANAIKTRANTKGTRNKHAHAALGQRHIQGENYGIISGIKSLRWHHEHVDCQPPIPGTPKASKMQRMYHEEATRNWAYITLYK